MFLEILEDVLKNSILITGLVIMMMLMIEYINIQSQGHWSSKLRGSSIGQVILGALLGIVPGCIGGFAVVSLYTHGIVSFGALVAMMIASSGDEAFVMLATIPKEALILSAILFVIAVASGLVINTFSRGKQLTHRCREEFEVHLSDCHHQDNDGHCDKSGNCPHASLKNLLHPSWQRIVLLLGVASFIVALSFGQLEHEHEAAGDGHTHGLNLLDEYWLNLIFAILSLFVLFFVATAKEHFIKEHLWHHVICRHFLQIFCWTFGALLVIETGLQYLNLEQWVQGNIPLMILFAVLIGIIPESGPHILFITLFAGGYVPFSVLLASSISQDGHAAIPLFAESKLSFILAKGVNAAIALAAGFVCYCLGF